MSDGRHISESLEILKMLGFPRPQQNERTALCLLALLGLRPDQEWSQASAPRMGITQIMTWVRDYYSRDYAPNTRETFRRQSMHQFVESGFSLRNPDDPSRAVNSPNTVYQIAPEALVLMQKFSTSDWQLEVAAYKRRHPSLIQRYARQREQHLVQVPLSGGQKLSLTPGKHSELLRKIIEDFAPGFFPGSRLVYVGDTGTKFGFFEKKILEDLGIHLDLHGKMPDVIFYLSDKNWLILVEAVTSHGPIDGKRYHELENLFRSPRVGLVYVTAFPDRKFMSRYLSDIAWETEVWTADDPSHLIHFDGDRFLGPY